MSAYVNHPAHINYLVLAAIHYNRPYQSVRFDGEPVNYENGSRVGAALLAENITSVSYRYPDDDLTDLPGPIPTPSAIDFRLSLTPARPIEPVQVLKAINGYRYQTCEHPEWEASQAYAFCDALEHEAISRLPGYEDAAWEIDGPMPVDRSISLLSLVKTETPAPVAKWSDPKLTPWAAAAKMIRAELKAAFPAVKFSVTSESFSMGSAVDVTWTDGPHETEVHPIASKYQYGHFDGMTDSYDYTNRRADLPQVKYVQLHRSVTAPVSGGDHDHDSPANPAPDSAEPATTGNDGADATGNGIAYRIEYSAYRVTSAATRAKLPAPNVSTVVVDVPPSYADLERTLGAMVAEPIASTTHGEMQFWKPDGPDNVAGWLTCVVISAEERCAYVPPAPVSGGDHEPARYSVLVERSSDKGRTYQIDTTGEADDLPDDQTCSSIVIDGPRYVATYLRRDGRDLVRTTYTRCEATSAPQSNATTTEPGQPAPASPEPAGDVDVALLQEQADFCRTLVDEMPQHHECDQWTTMPFSRVFAGDLTAEAMIENLMGYLDQLAETIRDLESDRDDADAAVESAGRVFTDALIFKDSERLKDAYRELVGDFPMHEVPRFAA